MFRLTFRSLARSLTQPTLNTSRARSTLPVSASISPSENRLLSDVREVQMPVPWGHVSGKWWGRQDIQPVIAIHGWQDNANSFDTLIPLLKVESVLAYDMIGHGKSSHFPIGQCYHFVNELVNLRRLVKHYNWSNVTIIGHSMGSVLGYSYAGYFPDDVNRFISLDCVRQPISQGTESLVHDVRKVFETTLSIEEKLVQEPPSHSYDDIVDLYLSGSNGAMTRESCEIILKRGLTKVGDGKFCLSRDPRMKLVPIGCHNDEVLYAIASLITCEVLSIRALDGFSLAGNENVFAKTCEIMAKSAKRFEHNEVEGTHHVHLNNPERVADIINTFLAERQETKIY